MKQRYLVGLLCLGLTACNAVDTLPPYVDRDALRNKQDGKADVVQVIELNVGCNPGYKPRAENQVGHIVVLCDKIPAEVKP